MRTKQVFTAMVAIAVSSLIACKTSPKDMLTRRWKAVNAEGITITPEIKKSITDDKKALEFTKEGRYITYNNGQKFDRGVYILSDDAKTINVSSGTGSTQAMHIMNLSDNELIGEMHGITITFEPSK